MWLSSTVATFVGLFLGMTILGWIGGVASVMLGARLVANFSRGRSVLTGKSPGLESLPFIIKDDAMERRLEDEALGYKPMETFDHVEGLGR